MIRKGPFPTTARHKTNMKITLCLMLALTTVSALSSFRSLLPNGDKVLDPCSTTGDVAPGVGHIYALGGGPRNPFGNDFQLAGHEWNAVLCKKDSDGDGKSNGEELGDSQCAWTPTNGAPLATPTGHPGVCEPVGSAACASQNFNCSATIRPG